MDIETTRKTLADKYLKLSNHLTNFYNDSELDITDEQYNRLSNWIKYTEKYIRSAAIFFSEFALKGYENDYDIIEKDIYSKYHK